MGERRVLERIFEREATFEREEVRETRHLGEKGKVER